jgi:hypothetical protein
VTAAATGGTPTSLDVISTPGSFTGTGATSPVTVTGLQSQTSYTFTATSTSAGGTSAATAASNSITATTVPQAPTIGTATLSTTTASVPFTAGATGGSIITSYTATSSPGSLTGTGASSPISVSGLTPGISYTFTVTATNANGTSTASSASNSLTPAYVLGGVGQGGGKIFYDAGSTLSWGRYLEMATSSTSPAWTDAYVEWSGNTDGFTYTATAIGTGKTNTNLVIANNSTANRAMTVTRAYTGGGYSGASTGWFTPSKDELNQLWLNGGWPTGFTGATYWSSSEVDNYYAHYHNLSSGYPTTGAKYYQLYVRAVRSF